MSREMVLLLGVGVEPECCGWHGWFGGRTGGVRGGVVVDLTDCWGLAHAFGGQWAGDAIEWIVACQVKRAWLP